MRASIKCAATLSLLFLFIGGCTQSEQAEVVQVEAVACDAAASTCQVEVDGKAVSLSLQPGLVPLKPFAISATIEDSGEIGQVLLDFQMVGMEMGPNRYSLLLQEGQWQGSATLPVCTASRGDWVAILEFQRGSRHYRVHFPFTSN